MSSFKITEKQTGKVLEFKDGTLSADALTADNVNVSAVNMGDKQTTQNNGATHSVFKTAHGDIPVSGDDQARAPTQGDLDALEARNKSLDAEATLTTKAMPINKKNVDASGFEANADVVSGFKSQLSSGRVSSTPEMTVLSTDEQSIHAAGNVVAAPGDDDHVKCALFEGLGKDYQYEGKQQVTSNETIPAGAFGPTAVPQQPEISDVTVNHGDELKIEARISGYAGSNMTVDIKDNAYIKKSETSGYGWEFTAEYKDGSCPDQIEAEIKVESANAKKTGKHFGSVEEFQTHSNAGYAVNGVSLPVEVDNYTTDAEIAKALFDLDSQIDEAMQAVSDAANKLREARQNGWDDAALQALKDADSSAKAALQGKIDAIAAQQKIALENQYIFDNDPAMAGLLESLAAKSIEADNHLLYDGDARRYRQNFEALWKVYTARTPTGVRGVVSSNSKSYMYLYLADAIAHVPGMDSNGVKNNLRESQEIFAPIAADADLNGSNGEAAQTAAWATLETKLALIESDYNSSGSYEQIATAWASLQADFPLKESMVYKTIHYSSYYLNSVLPAADARASIAKIDQADVAGSCQTLIDAAVAAKDDALAQAALRDSLTNPAYEASAVCNGRMNTMSQLSEFDISSAITAEAATVAGLAGITAQNLKDIRDNGAPKLVGVDDHIAKVFRGIDSLVDPMGTLGGYTGLNGSSSSPATYNFASSSAKYVDDAAAFEGMWTAAVATIDAKLTPGSQIHLWAQHWLLTKLQGATSRGPDAENVNEVQTTVTAYVIARAFIAAKRASLPAFDTSDVGMYLKAKNDDESAYRYWYYSQGYYGSHATYGNGMDTAALSGSNGRCDSDHG